MKTKYVILILKRINDVNTLIERKVLTKIQNPLKLRGGGSLIIDYSKPTYFNNSKYYYLVSDSILIDKNAFTSDEVQRLFDMKIIESLVHATKEKPPMMYIILSLLSGLLGFFIAMSIFKNTTGGTDIIVP